MALIAKHIVEEINGTRCTVVEKGIPAERVKFLTDLLTFNKLEVVVAEVAKTDETAPTLFTLGVTDIIFHPTIAVYEMGLITRDGKKVSPAYWDQLTTEINDEYWTFEKK